MFKVLWLCYRVSYMHLIMYTVIRQIVQSYGYVIICHIHWKREQTYTQIDSVHEANFLFYITFWILAVENQVVIHTCYETTIWSSVTAAVLNLDNKCHDFRYVHCLLLTTNIQQNLEKIRWMTIYKYNYWYNILTQYAHDKRLYKLYRVL